MGLFTNYAELGQRNFTKWRSLATDLFVQDSWKPSSALTIEGGVRWVYWPPWYSTTNNIANFDPRFYDRAQAAVIDPTTGRLVAGPRYNGLVLPGDGFEGDATQSVVAQDPAVLALFRGEPRGFSQTHANAFEPRLGAAYKFNEKTVLRLSTGVFHNRVTLNDSTLLGGNVPFQPQVTISNGSADNPGGGTVGSKDLPFTVTGQDAVFKHPTAYMYSVGIQREIPFGFTVDASYVGRKGLYLQRERNLNQLLPGTIQANPGVNIAALRPYTGYGVIRLSENAGRSTYNSFQISADRRYTKGLKVGFAYTLGKSEDNGSDKRNVLWNTYDDTAFWGPSNFDRRHVLAVYYIYDLPFFREGSGLLSNLLGGWQVSGASFFRTGTPFSIVQDSQDVAGVGDVSVGQPWDLVGDPKANTNGKFSAGSSDQNFWFNPAAFARPAPGTFGNAPRNLLYNPGEQQWDIAVFKNFRMGGTRLVQVRGEFFNFPNHPNLGNPGGERVGADPKSDGRYGHRRSDQRQQLRPSDHQERSARHPVERSVPVLAGATRPSAGGGRRVAARLNTQVPGSISSRDLFFTTHTASARRGRRPPNLRRHLRLLSVAPSPVACRPLPADATRPAAHRPPPTAHRPAPSAQRLQSRHVGPIDLPRRVPHPLALGLHDQQLPRRDAAGRLSVTRRLRGDLGDARRARLGRAMVDDGKRSG